MENTAVNWTGDSKEIPLPLLASMIENVVMSMDLQALRDFIAKRETDLRCYDKDFRRSVAAAKLLLFYAIELTELRQ